MTEPPHVVRPIRPDEVATAIDVWLATDAARGVVSLGRHLATVHRQLGTTSDVALVCVRDEDAVVGFVTGELRQVDGTDVRGAMQLQSIFVSPDAQGAGVGSRLLEAFLAEARQRGRTETHLWLRSKNHGPRRLYER